MQAAVKISAEHVRIDSCNGVVAKVQSSCGDTEYTVTDPYARYAACSCPAATQQQMCKHQLAVLLQKWPGHSAACIMLKMLGSQLGQKEGCDPQDEFPLAKLTQALQNAQAAGKLHSSMPELPLASQLAALAAAHSAALQPAAAAQEPAAPAAATQEHACDDALEASAADELPASFSPDKRAAAPEHKPALQSTEEAAAAAAELVSKQRQRYTAHIDQRLAEIAQAASAERELLSVAELRSFAQSMDMGVSHVIRTRKAFGDKASSAPLPSIQQPAGQSSRRARDALEVSNKTRKKRKVEPGGAGAPAAEHAAAPLLQRDLPGTQGMAGVWKRNRSMRSVMHDACFAPAQGKPADAPHHAADDAEADWYPDENACGSSESAQPAAIPSAALSAGGLLPLQSSTAPQRPRRNAKASAKSWRNQDHVNIDEAIASMESG